MQNGITLMQGPNKKFPKFSLSTFTQRNCKHSLRHAKHRAAHQVAVYEHTLSASEGLRGELCLVESLLKTHPYLQLLFWPNSPPSLTTSWCCVFGFFLGEHHDDRCALVTKYYALRILFFTAPLGVKPYSILQCPEKSQKVLELPNGSKRCVSSPCSEHATICEQVPVTDHWCLGWCL